MEEIRYKLAKGKPSMIGMAVAKLYDMVKLKCGDLSQPLKFTLLQEHQQPELFMLWKEVKSEHLAVAVASSKLMVDLAIQEAILEPMSLLSSFLAAASQVKCPQGIVSGIGELLLFIADGHDTAFGVNVNQHPFISLIRSSPNQMWPFVVDEMKLVFSKVTASKALAMLSPVYLFALCNPHNEDSYSAFRAAVRSDLCEQLKTCNDDRPCLFTLMEWLNFSNPNCFGENTNFILQVIKWQARNSGEKGQIYLPYLLSLAVESLKVDFCPSVLMQHIVYEIVPNLRAEDVHLANVTAVVLGQFLERCPFPLYELAVNAASSLFRTKLLLPYQKASIAVPLLHILSQPSSLICKVAKTATEIIEMASANVEPTHPETKLVFPSVPFAWNPVLRESDKLNNWMNSLNKFKIDDEEAVLMSWFKEYFGEGRRTQLNELAVLFQCLLFRTDSPRVADRCIWQLGTCIQRDPDLAPQTMSLFMFKLSRSQCPEMLFQLLMGFPELGRERSCIGQILLLLNTLSSRPKMSTMVLRLYYELWLVENRCYPSLLRCLQSKNPGDSSNDFNLAKAKIMLNICQRKPAQHGPDLLKVMSDLLNECCDGNQTSVCTLALKGIRLLCSEAVIDFMTTVRVLAPTLRTDPRPEVKVQYFALLGLAPTFNLSGDEFDTFLSQTLSYLWQQANSCPDPAMRQAALDVLTSFPSDCHTLQMLPVQAKADLKVPPGLIKDFDPTTQTIEEVLTFVPGQCWINLIGWSDLYTRFFYDLMAKEVKMMPKSVYYLGESDRPEPANYNYLPEKSILRAIIGFLRQCDADSSKRDPTVVQICVQALSQPLGRALPPFDWATLENSPVMRKDSFMQIIAMQSPHSRSAKRLLESALANVSVYRFAPEIFASLKEVLTAGIDNTYLMEQFVLTSLMNWQTSAQRDHDAKDKFVSLLVSLGDVFSNDSIDPSVKEQVGSWMEKFADQYQYDDDQLLDDLLRAVSKMPLTNLKRLSNPSVWWRVSDAKMHFAIRIRRQLAISEDTESPLTWLNDVIEFLTQRHGEVSSSVFDFFLSHFRDVLTFARTNFVQHNLTWLSELMGLIRALLRTQHGSDALLDAMSNTSGGFHFLFDVFVFSMIHLTEVDSLALNADMWKKYSAWEQRLSLLPLAVNRLLLHFPSHLSQAMAEWLLHVKAHGRSRLLPAHLKAIDSTFSAFKCDQDMYRESYIWGRLLPASLS